MYDGCVEPGMGGDKFSDVVTPAAGDESTIFRHRVAMIFGRLVVKNIATLIERRADLRRLIFLHQWSRE